MPKSRCVHLIGPVRGHAMSLLRDRTVHLSPRLSGSALTFRRSVARRTGEARLVLVCALLAALSGCDQLGLETPAKATERKLAEAKAVGSACRHAMRAIEDCYVLNPKADKSAVFAGWREMDEYMRENKLEGVTPVVPRPAPPAPKASVPAKADGEEGADEEGVADAKPHKAGGH